MKNVGMREVLTERAEEAGPVRKREAWALACLTVAALVVRLAALRFETVVTPDGVSYANVARAFVEGRFADFLHTYWPPLYPLLVALASYVTGGDLELGGRFVSVAAGGALVVPVYFLMRGADGRRVAALGALLAALHPLLVYYSTLLLTESTYTLLFVCGVLAGWRALASARARYYALAGLAFGACYLLKPEAAGFFVLLLVLTFGVAWFGRRHSLGRAARHGAWLASAFLLLALPYVLYLHHELGRWTISGKLSEHLLQGDRFGGLAASGAPSLVVTITQLARALRHEYEVLNLIFPPTFVLLAGVGLFRASWTRRRAARELYLMLFVAAALAGYAVTLPNIRFLVPLLPLLLCWVARGVFELEDWLARTLEGARAARFFTTRGGWPFKSAVAALLVVSLAPLTVYLFRGNKWYDYDGQRRAALWIKARHESRDTPPNVMATVPIAPFYAGASHTKINPEDDHEMLIARVRYSRVDYIVINEREFKNMRLRALLEEETPHAGLRLVYKFSHAPGFKVLVYAPDS